MTILLQTFQTKYFFLNVLPCPSISDHHAPYIIAKIPTNKYQPLYIFIRDMKNFDLQKYIDDVKQLPFSIVYSFDNLDDQRDILNKIILECVELHAPLKRTKSTRHSTSWMKDLDIVALQNQRNKLRYEAHSKRTTSAWVAYRKVRNEIKQNKYNYNIILQKHFEFKEHERYMENHSPYSKSKEIKISTNFLITPPHT